MNLTTKQQKLLLDINQKCYKTILAKQYDKNSRLIPIQCTDNGKLLPLNPSCTVQVKMITPDQRAILSTVPVQEDGSLLMELTESMLFYPGKAKAELRIYDPHSRLLPDMTYDTSESSVLSTMQFTVIIEPSVFDDDRIIDTDEFNALTDLIEKANADYTAVLSAAQDSADASHASADASQTSATAAQASADSASDSKTQAAASAGNASSSASTAAQLASQASAFADSAAGCADAAAQTAALSEASADLAQSRATEAASFAHGGTATREGEDSDNAQYYYLQSKNISESLSGALRPMGTVAFDSLPALSLATEGDMYNVSDEFTTTSDFKEGEDHVIPAGANIYKTSDGCWDVLAGSPVTGIKGSSETAYRRGNVNLTKADIGLANVDNTADADKNVKYAASAAQAVQDNKGNVIFDTYLKRSDLLDAVYPVGAIYMSVNSTNPGTLFGGTWVTWGTGRVPVGVDTSTGYFNTVEKTGGEREHILTNHELPRHTHEILMKCTEVDGPGYYLAHSSSGIVGGYNDRVMVTASAGYSTNVKTVAYGDGASHNNLQPYITCYMWKRTA